MAINAGEITTGILWIQAAVLHTLDDVGRIEIAAIGNSGGQIANLQRRGGNFTLPNRNGNHGQAIPSAMIGLIIILRVGNHSSFLAR